MITYVKGINTKKLYNTLIININRSNLFAGYVAMVTIGAVSIIVILPLGVVLKMILVGPLLAWSYHVWRIHVRHDHPAAIRAFQLDGRNRCTVQLWGDERWQPCTVVSTWAHPFVTVLVLKPAGNPRPQTLLILPDAVDRRSFTHLRARLDLVVNRG